MENLMVLWEAFIEAPVGWPKAFLTGVFATWLLCVGSSAYFLLRRQ